MSCKAWSPCIIFLKRTFPSFLHSSFLWFHILCQIDKVLCVQPNKETVPPPAIMCFSRWERKGMKRQWIFFGLCLYACRLVFGILSVGGHMEDFVCPCNVLDECLPSICNSTLHFRTRGVLCNISVKANVVIAALYSLRCDSGLLPPPCSSAVCMCVCWGDTAKGVMTDVIKINLPVGARVYIHQPIWVSLLGWFSLGNSICHLLNAANVHGVPAACVP